MFHTFLCWNPHFNIKYTISESVQDNGLRISHPVSVLFLTYAVIQLLQHCFIVNIFIPSPGITHKSLASVIDQVMICVR